MAGKIQIHYEIGQKLGSCVFLGEAGYVQGKEWKERAAYFECHFCGNKFKAILNRVRMNSIKSCGCAKFIPPHNKRHGKAGSAEYKSWSGAKSRCLNKNLRFYSEWGGRGICVCRGWLNSFDNFYADMGERPSPNHSLDRIKNDLNYSCGHCQECIEKGWKLNCRWAIPLVQNNNKRNNKKVSYKGRSMTITMWQKETGILSHTIRYRIKQGWPMEKVFSNHSFNSNKKSVKNCL